MKSYSDNESDVTKAMIDAQTCVTEARISEAEARVNEAIINNNAAAKKRDLIIFIVAICGIALGALNWMHP